MKYYIFRNILLLIMLFPLSGNSEQPMPSHNIEIQQTRRSKRHDLELNVSANLALTKDALRSRLITVEFTVKNVSKDIIGILHYGDDYRGSVEICLADKFDEPNELFPLPLARGGSIQKIVPGESIIFYIYVPTELMNGKKYIAGIAYGTATFEGEAFSKPFIFPSLK